MGREFNSDILLPVAVVAMRGRRKSGTYLLHVGRLEQSLRKPESKSSHGPYPTLRSRLHL